MENPFRQNRPRQTLGDNKGIFAEGIEEFA
jgi:hypothetical protein